MDAPGTRREKGPASLYAACMARATGDCLAFTEHVNVRWLVGEEKGEGSTGPLETATREEVTRPVSRSGGFHGATLQSN